MTPPPLPPSLHGKRLALTGSGPTVYAYASLYEAGDAQGLDGRPSPAAPAVPLLLVHSVSAGASALEMRPLFERYGAIRPTLAIDLPGFGRSQRGPLDYTPALMAQAVLRAAHQLRAWKNAAAVDVLALSLSCEFVALAALKQPSWFRSVALVSPTGLESGLAERYQQGRSKDKPLLRRGLASRWGAPVFRWLTTEAVMRSFMERAWGSSMIDEAQLASARSSARRPGARPALAAFAAGALFTVGIADRYAQLAPPVWLAHGVRGGFANFGGLARIGPPRHWSQDTFGTGALPHLETPDLFMARYDNFLGRVEDPASALAAAHAPPAFMARVSTAWEPAALQPSILR